MNLVRPLSTAIAFGALVTLLPDVAHAGVTEDCIAASDQGQRLRDDGKLGEARNRFMLCARPQCPNVVQTDCAAWLADVQARMPTLVLAAKDDAGNDLVDVTVTMDGEPLLSRLGPRAIPIDPGDHIFRFTWHDAPPFQVHILAREGEQRRQVLATFKRPPSSAAPPASTSPPPPAQDAESKHVPASTWALGGVAVLSLATFGYFYASGLSDRHDLERSCSPHCTDTEVDPARRKIFVADIALGVGAVAAVSALVFYLLAPSTSTTHATNAGSR